MTQIKVPTALIASVHGEGQHLFEPMAARCTCTTIHKIYRQRIHRYVPYCDLYGQYCQHKYGIFCDIVLTL
jgi:ribosomally synthesized peptide (plantazolicin-class)